MCYSQQGLSYKIKMTLLRKFASQQKTHMSRGTASEMVVSILAKALIFPQTSLLQAKEWLPLMKAINGA